MSFYVHIWVYDFSNHFYMTSESRSKGAQTSNASLTEEVKRLALEAKKKALEAEIQKVVDTVTTQAEATVAKAEEAGKTEELSRDSLNGSPNKDAVSKAVESAASALKDAQSELGEVRKRLSDMVSTADDDVKQWLQLETRKVEMKVAAMDARLVQNGQATERGRQFLQTLEAKELQTAKFEVAKLLRSKKLDAEELFKVLLFDLAIFCFSCPVHHPCVQERAAVARMKNHHSSEPLRYLHEKKKLCKVAGITGVGLLAFVGS